MGNVMWILDRPQETLKDMLHDFCHNYCWLSVSHEGFRRDAIISCCKPKKSKYGCVKAVDLRCSFLQVVVLGASLLGSGEDTRGLDWPWVRLMGSQETLQDALKTLVKFWQYVFRGST